MDNLEIANIYLELIGIIEDKFQKRVGAEFSGILDRCRDVLPFQCKELLQSFRISREMDRDMAEEICAFLPGNGNAAESRLLLISSLNQLSFLLIMKMKEEYGVETAESALDEMIEALKKRAKYHHDRSMVDYLKGNVDDLLKQIKEA